MPKIGEPLSITDYSKIDPNFAREQALANCKILFGPDVQIITINLGDSGHGSVAMKAAAVSRISDGWTEHLAISTFLFGHKAIIKLLCKSEEELGKKHKINADINADIDTKETIAAWSLG